ncbi:hypothetical protein EVAR_20967_1 [Eumeta japonica]|uniref:Uncharacterized protein n=1 Tax=Eumeta variegata TaxID=151549 RepID=A0A4C1V648_EUMVA|nr:hypothetical protein EVAR_20967_1 [Eumeta japonica]
MNLPNKRKVRLSQYPRSHRADKLASRACSLSHAAELEAEKQLGEVREEVITMEFVAKWANIKVPAIKDEIEDEEPSSAVSFEDAVARAEA